MPAARRCSFCGDRVDPGSGLMFVKKDGTIQFFCSAKCEKNVKLGRKPYRVRWTERYRRSKGKT